MSRRLLILIKSFQKSFKSFVFKILTCIDKIPKRETLGPVELVFKNKGRNYGHFERVKVEKRDKN